MLILRVGSLLACTTECSANQTTSRSGSNKAGVEKSRTIPFKASSKSRPMFDHLLSSYLLCAYTQGQFKPLLVLLSSLSFGHPLLDKLKTSFPPNIVRNQKYNLLSFLPLVLYEQFKFFFNLYFLLVALSQFVPALKIGFIVTYVAPLAFVLLVTMGKEAFDDWQRNLRDREANSARYLVLLDEGGGGKGIPPTRAVASSTIKVGDLVLLEKNQRVPADMVLLRTSDSSGTAFVRTDQLDGETDWKLRVAVPMCQKLEEEELLRLDGEVYGQFIPFMCPLILVCCGDLNSIV